MLIIAIYEDQESQLKVSYRNYDTCKLFDPKITGDKLVPKFWRIIESCTLYSGYN